ncbi:putative inhibitor of apoptosis [Haliotis cracherodii]|uniref:putative inhibitor of apoptosis n=1 Tax=Haliotis cracherodii TaxID=6455 RepID=UPI0039EA6C6E
MEHDQTYKRSSNIPRHPQYQTYSSRLDSFVAWPIRYVPKTPEQLASAGFFYIGSADRVTCFHCGITLRDWEEEHDPVAEHQRYSEHCQFINSVDVNQLGVVQRRNSSFVNSSASCNTDVEDAKVTCKPNGEKVNNIVFSTPARPGISDIREANSDLHLGGGACSHSRGVDVQSEATADVQSTRSLSSLCGRLEALTVQQTKDGSAGSVTSKDATIPTRKQKMGVQSSKLPTTHHGRIGESKVAKFPNQKLISMKAENRRLKEQSTCRKCRINAVSILFLPCGHLVTCSDCADKVHACVVCGTTILGTVKTFIT